MSEDFDDFFNRFLAISLHISDLLKVDESLIGILLDCKNEQLFNIKCWLAQKRLYFGW